MVRLRLRPALGVFVLLVAVLALASEGKAVAKAPVKAKAPAKVSVKPPAKVSGKKNGVVCKKGEHVCHRLHHFATVCTLPARGPLRFDFLASRFARAQICLNLRTRVKSCLSNQKLCPCTQWLACALHWWAAAAAAAAVAAAAGHARAVYRSETQRSSCTRLSTFPFLRMSIRPCPPLGPHANRIYTAFLAGSHPNDQVRAGLPSLPRHPTSRQRLLHADSPRTCRARAHPQTVHAHAHTHGSAFDHTPGAEVSCAGCARRLTCPGMSWRDPRGHGGAGERGSHERQCLP